MGCCFGKKQYPLLENYDDESLDSVNIYFNANESQYRHPTLTKPRKSAFKEYNIRKYIPRRNLFGDL